MFYDYGDYPGAPQRVFVAPSTGGTFDWYFGWANMRRNEFDFDSVAHVVSGDFTGDGKDDLAMFYEY